MSFKESLSKFDFLSELYERDAPDAVLMTEYPSSNSPEARFQNKTKYVIHDPYPPPPVSLLKTLGPHHLMYGWGNKIPVSSELNPSRILTDHWERAFGKKGVPNWLPYNHKHNYITSFPFETIPESQQIIAPDMLHHLHSKKAIAEIPCSQAAVFDHVQFPCIMKLSHGYAGLGNFFIRNKDDLEKTHLKIDAHWPDAPIVINQILSNIVGDYGVQFYLNKKGAIIWLGFTEQIFDKSGRWSGGIFNADMQDELYEDFLKIAEPVAKYLFERGYFGVVGIDILRNKNNDFFLVDLNPRLTGSTPFLIASRLFISDGYTQGVYAASVELSGDLSDIIKRAEEIKEARVLILSACQEPDASSTKCHISISANNYQMCTKTLFKMTDRL